MTELVKNRKLSPEQIAVRKRFIGATFVTCIVVALVAGTIHVLELGANRMNQMRSLAGIDLSKESNHIRAAGEDLYISDRHEKRETHKETYSVDEANKLVEDKVWTLLAELVSIPSGEFVMGTDNPKSDEQNRPAFRSEIKAYQISKYPITNAQYAKFVASTGHRPPIHWVNGRIPEGVETHPVTMVTWFDASKYAAWAGGRLPTEAEWEKAARGTDGRRWPWGDQMNTKNLNTYYNRGSTSSVFEYPQGVSPFGVMDMAGNVQEWVANDLIPYEGSQASDSLFKAKVPQIPVDAAERSLRMVEFVETEERYKVMRGGSWKSDPFSTSSYHRNFSWPNFTSDFYGFRIAKDVN
ncbi:MAG: formylglycine-generating enzyme family protein [Gammaproteobacteria bacterium]|nr:formylglycine-generating enzyme family protein [Gammaproteobacteria bacterium]